LCWQRAKLYVVDLAAAATAAAAAAVSIPNFTDIIS
jgi:hypothetical protein